MIKLVALMTWKQVSTVLVDMRVDILQYAQYNKMIKLGRFCSIRGSEESQMLVIFVHNRGEEKLLRKYGGVFYP